VSLIKPATIGSRGEPVRRLQENLKALGFYPHLVDGEFGWRTRDAVFAFQERYFCDGIVDEKTECAVTEAVAAWANRDENILLPVPHGLAEVEKQFGHIEFEDTEGGYVRIVNNFADYISEFNFPVVGRQLLHQKLEPVLTSVLVEIEKRGLDRDILQFGSWCPRHKFHDPRWGLSLHSYGVAVDINQATNQPGTRGNLHPGIVDVFERHGWKWGGRWRILDPMHFQLATGI